MRSDVKVGMICAFALLLCIVGYFAWGGGGKAPQRTQAAQSGQQPIGDVGTPPGEPTKALTVDPVNNITNTSAGNGGLQTQVDPGGKLTDDGGTTVTSGAGSHGASKGLGGTDPVSGTSGAVIGGSTGSNSGAAKSGPTGGTPAGGTPAGGSASSGTIDIGPGTSAGTAAGATTAVTEYAVQKGDNVWTIARKFKITREALMTANSLTPESTLSIKQVLKIPAGATLPTAGSAASGASGAAKSAGTSGAAAKTTGSTATPAAAKSYTVKANDTLRKIAKNVYGDENQWTKIYNANKAAIGDANTVKPGMVLKIPA